VDHSGAAQRRPGTDRNEVFGLWIGGVASPNFIFRCLLILASDDVGSTPILPNSDEDHETVLGVRHEPEYDLFGLADIGALVGDDQRALELPFCAH
jgi:hypothetical protein